MSVLCVGLSHHSAPVALLERVAITPEDLPKALHELQQGAHVLESIVLSTCNRVEVYADVLRFHGGVQEASELLAQVSGVPLEALSEHLYVHYEERAVQHLLAVACGLDSMVVGEGQILGQLRAAYRLAREEGSLGRALGELLQHALRVGKRARAETGIGRAGASLVSAGLRLAENEIGPLAGRSALVVGAGHMGVLAATTLRRAGAGVVIANRTPARADALAAQTEARVVGLDGLAAELVSADLVVTVTGASGTVVTREAVEQAMTARDHRPLFVLDLALPRDVDPAAREIDGVTYADLDTLRGPAADAVTGADVEAVRHIVADEVEVFLAGQRSMRVAPTVVALRAKADALIEAELDRLGSRVPDLDARERTEVDAAVRRVVDKLLHAPTVRVKELAEAPGGDRYAEALRELFGLDPHVPEAVLAVEPPDEPGERL